MAITTQLVGKLGGVKWETIEIPQMTITGGSPYSNPKTMTSVTVPDGKIFVGYATLNVTSVTPGKYGAYHGGVFYYPSEDSYLKNTPTITLNKVSVIKVQAIAYGPNIADYTPYSDQVYFGLIGGGDADGSYPATSTTFSGSMKYTFLDL